MYPLYCPGLGSKYTLKVRYKFLKPFTNNSACELMRIIITGQILCTTLKGGTLGNDFKKSVNLGFYLVYN